MNYFPLKHDKGYTLINLDHVDQVDIVNNSSDDMTSYLVFVQYQQGGYRTPLIVSSIRRLGETSAAEASIEALKQAVHGNHPR